MKATAIAPSNIAFIKYWGKKDDELRLPANGSISMNLSGLYTTTTVEFATKYKSDSVIIDGKNLKYEAKRVVVHLDRVRNIANLILRAKVVSKNNFPNSTGLSSSASGMAALTVAASNAAGLKLPEKDLSILARLGSGSACRSIPDGFVEWIEGSNTNDSSYAYSLYPSNYWKILDVVAVVSKDKKEIATTEGQKSVETSPFFKSRLSRLQAKLILCKEFIRKKNFKKFGELIEAESLELHAIMLTSIPSLIYWLPGTIQIMKAVKKWRSENLPVYFTINTGHAVHILVEEKNKDTLLKKLGEEKYIKKIIVNKPTNGARISDKHLF